ncbi:hypothetical protein BCR44DRAFT_207918 [Catenaria anguillulae PL171]|uniref:Uncharacterized protein n=1 Tax=Catenaria anguillulae PL171 TaxID=765915 RepID=A0A1Y2HNY3_9FUNG|nr:hypothetical protein BCR44DRAFT_207918 [Catenaria anguillulae PL171]
MPMIFMTIATVTDCVLTFVTFHVVWHVRSKVVRSAIRSDNGAKAGGKLKSESTLILASMDSLPSSPTPINAPNSGNGPGGVEQAMPAGTFQSSSHRSTTASGSSGAAATPVHVHGLTPQERRENRRRRRAGLRRALKKLMVALTLMLVSVLGGMLCFGLSAGNMLADTISGVFVRMYLLPAISSWSLLVTISKANRM